MKTVHAKFIIRTDKKRKDEKCPINIRVSMDNKVTKLATGVTLHKEDWSKKTGFVKKGKELINQRKTLAACMRKVEDYVDNNNRYNKPFTIQDLKDAYKGVEDKNFFHYYDDFLRHKELNDDVSKGTLYIYKVLGEQLYEYKSDLRIGEVNRKFIECFFLYLRTVKGVENLFNKRKNLVAFFNKMKADNLIDENPLKGISIPKTKRKIMFLTKQEQFDFCTVKTKGTGLELSQDIYEFACYTGLRYGDVFQLKSFEIIDSVIVKEQTKVSREVRIPLTARPLEILEKYNYREKKGHEFVFPQKSNAAVNRDLKTLAKMAGINKPIKFHSARHTFGTRLAEENTNAFTIMKLMGHKNVNMTMIYIQDDIDILSKAMHRVNFV